MSDNVLSLMLGIMLPFEGIEIAQKTYIQGVFQKNVLGLAIMGTYFPIRHAYC